MNWDVLLIKKIIPPFKPCIENQEDATHFDPEFREMPINSFSQNSSNNNQFDYSNFSYNKKELT